MDIIAHRSNYETIASTTIILRLSSDSAAHEWDDVSYIYREKTHSTAKNVDR